MTSVSSPFVTTDTPAQMSKSCPPLSSFNHVSFLCANVEHTKCFYRDVLGFIEVKRPESFDFEGSWLFGQSGIAIHLISGEPPLKPRPINPQDLHVSFLGVSAALCYDETTKWRALLQTPDLDVLEAHLKKNAIPSVRATVMEGNNRVTQVFCHDPDNNMLEFCNCNCIPIVPLSALHATTHPSLTKMEGCESVPDTRMSTDSALASCEAVEVPSHDSSTVSE